MSTSRKVAAWLNLAWHFAKHVVIRLPLRPFRHGKDMARFKTAIAPEGFVPLNTEQRTAFPAFMNCVHCGLCALACPELRAAPMSAWDDAWTFAGGASRSIDRAKLVSAQLSPCATCAECAAVCPTGVPITLMATVIKQL
jgi:succinate dehydrogenase/fumarate reductase-like Fe-S protein